MLGLLGEPRYTGTTMRIGAEKSLRLIAAHLASPGGWRASLQRARGLSFEPGATLDAMLLRGEARHADAASMSLFLLPAGATLVTALLSLNPSGVLAAVTADLLAVAILPSLIAWPMPGLTLLFDIDASVNRYRWRTFLTHALAPALVATAAARLLAPFSQTASFVVVFLGYLATARVFHLCCDDWVSVPESKRLQCASLYLSLLFIIGLFSTLLFRAGLIP